jgi:Fe-S cluster biogenesis protein NfuA
MRDDADIQARVVQLDDLLQQVESLPDADARNVALAAVQGLLELYGEGLARIVELAGPDRASAFAEDELVSHLLLLHGLHPVDVETRVRQALDEIRSTLAAQHGEVELLGIEAGTVRLRLHGSTGGCGGSAEGLERTIEQVLQAAAPDIERIDIEHAAADMEHAAATPRASFVALDGLVATGTRAQA